MNSALFGTPGTVLIDGYLLKHSKGFPRRSRKRWFVLNFTSLCYYEDHSCSNPVGCLVLQFPSCKVSQPIGAPRQLLLEGVVAAHKGLDDYSLNTYTFSASSETVAMEWYTALQEALARRNLNESIAATSSPSAQFSATVSSEISCLFDRATRLSCRIVDVAGDGACFFRSVAIALWRSESAHGLLRAAALMALRNLKYNYLECFPSKRHFERYVNAMAQPHAPADEVVVRALADALGTRIVVVTAEPTIFCRVYPPFITRTRRAAASSSGSCSLAGLTDCSPLAPTVVCQLCDHSTEGEIPHQVSGTAPASVLTPQGLLLEPDDIAVLYQSWGHYCALIPCCADSPQPASL